MLAATDRAAERIVRLRIAVQTQQREDRAGGPAHDVKLLVRCDQFVRKQPRCALRVVQQRAVAKAFCDYAKTIDNRTQASGGADAKRTRKPCRAAAVQVSADVGEPGKGKFGRWCATADGAMRRKKQRNSSGAIIEIRSQANELGHLGIAEPIESDPRRAAAAPDRMLRQFGRDLVGFGLEDGFVRRGRDLTVEPRTMLAVARSCGLLMKVFPNHLDLPIDFVPVERLQPSPGPVEPRRSHGLG
jgi:hypothetical protein